MKRSLLKSIGMISLLMTGLVAGAAKVFWWYEPQE